MASKRLRHVLKVFSSVGLLVLLKLVKSYPRALTFCQKTISKNYQSSRAQFLP